MGQKAITIYTPSGTAPHITAEDDAFIHCMPFQSESGIIGGLICQRVDDNTVRLSGGGVMNRGHILRIPDGETLTLTVESGTAGFQRCDCVAAEFIKGGGEDADVYRIRVVKGTPSAGQPAAPSLAQSDLVNKGDAHCVALYRLYLNGTSLVRIEQAGSRLPKLPRITVGSAAPSGGSDGDIYFRVTD